MLRDECLDLDNFGRALTVDSDQGREKMPGATLRADAADSLTCCIRFHSFEFEILAHSEEFTCNAEFFHGVKANTNSEVR